MPMKVFRKLRTTVRWLLHRREIEASLAHYERRTGDKADRRQTFADAGSFRSQVDRLFALGNAAETAEMKAIAEAAVASTLTNRFYRAADYLSDTLDDLERTTFFTWEPSGEPPFPSAEGSARAQKLKAVMEAWLVPRKVAAIEETLAAYRRGVGRSLAYRAFDRFERATARLFALVGESELRLVQERVSRLVERSASQAPADVVGEAVACLCGERVPVEVATLRTRRPDQPLRLSTVVPEERQDLLRAALPSRNPQ